MKKRILIALKIVVSASLLGYLFSKVDFQGAQASLLKVSYWCLVAAASVLLLQAVAGAVRLSMVLKTISTRIRLRAALHIMFIGLFFNQTLPSSIGGDAMRIWRIRHHGFPLRTAINSVLLDRLIGLVALGLFMLLSYPVLYPLVENSFLRAMVVLAALTLLAMFPGRRAVALLFDTRRGYCCVIYPQRRSAFRHAACDLFAVPFYHQHVFWSDLRVIATDAHLSHVHGLTCRDIKNVRFRKALKSSSDYDPDQEAFFSLIT